LGIASVDFGRPKATGRRGLCRQVKAAIAAQAAVAGGRDINEIKEPVELVSRLAGRKALFRWPSFSDRSVYFLFPPFGNAALCHDRRLPALEFPEIQLAVPIRVPLRDVVGAGLFEAYG